MSFGFGGEEPRPCSPRASALAAAVLGVTYADAELRAAKAKVPDYTGQWLDSDYYADQTDAYYRAAEALEQALIVDHTDKLALGAKFVPSAEYEAGAAAAQTQIVAWLRSNPGWPDAPFGMLGGIANCIEIGDHWKVQL